MATLYSPGGLEAGRAGSSPTQARAARHIAHLGLLAGLASEPANRWSLGSFGAIGEFLRDPDESVAIEKRPGSYSITTGRGGMRIAPTMQLVPVAWDILSADGQAWHHELAFCVPCPPTSKRTISALGRDREALRPDDSRGQLFDLGVAAGAVRMCVRTRDAGLIAALEAARGQALLAMPNLVDAIIRAQPHRVLLSPAGRIEVYQPIPLPGSSSPTGPHTHLLPKLVASGRTHASNSPIPEGLQAAISLHPQSPWRSPLGEPRPFAPEVDAAFSPLLARFGLAEDLQVGAEIRSAVEAGLAPEHFAWPETRRGRAKARITLRRLAAGGDERVLDWRAMRDRR